MKKLINGFVDTAIYLTPKMNTAKQIHAIRA